MSFCPIGIIKAIADGESNTKLQSLQQLSDRRCMSVMHIIIVSRYVVFLIKFVQSK